MSFTHYIKLDKNTVTNINLQKHFSVIIEGFITKNEIILNPHLLYF